MSKSLIKHCENDEFWLDAVPDRPNKNIARGANDLFINSEIWFCAPLRRMFLVGRKCFLAGQPKTGSNVLQYANLGYVYVFSEVGRNN